MLLWLRFFKQSLNLSFNFTGINQHVLSANVSLLRAAEVKDIIEGKDEKYKAISVHSVEAPVPRFEINSSI